MATSLDRALLLQQQNRPTDAEREYRNHLSQNPGDALAHACLAEVLVKQDRLDEASAEARQGIALAPDMAVGHYVMSKVLHARKRYVEALRAIDQAIQLDSYDADYHAFRAAVYMATQKWTEALKCTEDALSIDPENELATNLRAIVQTQMGRSGDAKQTIQGSLSRNPQNALSHATHGWALLHENKPAEAMTHFREALRLEPMNDYARSGMVEAVKARNPIYRAMLAYFLWMSRQGRAAQWGVVITVFAGQRFLGRVAKERPELAPLVYPILGLVIAFVFLTWIAVPLFDLMLRLHPMGKYALSREQRIGANLVCGALGSAVLALAIGLTTINGTLLLLALLSALMTVPLAAVMRCDKGWPRYTSMALSLVLGSAAALGYLFAGMPGESADKNANACLGIFFVGVFVGSFANNFLMRATARR